MTEQKKTTLTFVQRQRVELLQALAPLVRQPTGVLATAPVDRFELCELADWVLREGLHTPRPDPVIISGETELGAIALTDEARVEATVGGETQIGVYRSPEDGALWAETAQPLSEAQGKARDEVDLRATRSKVHDAVPDIRVALAEEAAEKQDEEANPDREFQKAWDSTEPIEPPTPFRAFDRFRR